MPRPNLEYTVSLLSLLSNMDSPPLAYSGHDFPQTLPLDLPLVSLTVEESVHYTLLGDASDEEWFTLTPVDTGVGYVRLGPEDRLFGVSMMHELHCLRILNLAFGKAKIATPHHIKHCLGYIRQGVLCSPDLTLEPGNFEERDFDVERTGATHTCKDWSAVYSFMGENSARWDSKNE